MSVPQLLLVKSAFQRGQNALAEKGPYSAGFAVSLFQDAIELMAWTIAKETDAKISDKAVFDSLWDAIKIAPKNPEQKELPAKAKILELNKARVGFKHYGNLPALSDAAKFEAYTEQFLTAACSLFFGREFADISLVDLIEHKEAADHIRAAEKALSLDDAGTALSECALAFYYFELPLEALAPGVDPRFSRVHPHDASPSVHRLEGAIQVMEKSYNRLRDFTVATGLGFSLFDYTRFQLVTPRVAVGMTGKYQIQWFGGRTPELENAKFAVKFIADFGIAVEGALAELTNTDREMLFGKRKLVYTPVTS